MKNITLKGQPNEVGLTEVLRDDDHAIIGTTSTGKRFVTRADRLDEPMPQSHPYRIYLTPEGVTAIVGHDVPQNGVVRAVVPTFAEIEAWFLDPEGSSADTIKIRNADTGAWHTLPRGGVLSLLSAKPEDSAAADAEAASIAKAESLLAGEVPEVPDAPPADLTDAAA